MYQELKVVIHHLVITNKQISSSDWPCVEKIALWFTK